MRPNRRIGGAALAALAIVGLSTLSCSKSDKPVAKVDGVAVTQEQWRVFLESHLVDPAGPKDKLDDAFKRLVRRSVASRLAEKRGLLKGADWERRKASLTEMSTLQAYLESKEPQRFALTEADARAYFNRHEELRFIRQVVCESEPKAQEALAKLQGGTPFGQVAKAYSIDKSSAPNGGEAGWARAADLPEFLAEKVFAQRPGEILGPIPVGKAWFLIEVGDVRTPPEAEFQERKSETIAHLRAQRLSESREKLGKELQARTPLSVRPEALKALESLEVKPGDEAAVAATIGKISVTVKDLKLFARDLAESASAPLPPEQRSEICEILALNRAIVSEAEADAIPKRPRTRAILWDNLEEAAGRVFADSYLKGLALPEGTLRDFYAKNPDVFTIPEGIRLRMLGAPSEEVLGRAIEAIQKGASWESVLQRFGPGGLASPGEATWVPVPELGRVFPEPLVAALSKAPAGKWVGPIPGEGGVSALLVLERHPKRLATFEEAGDKVKLAYLQSHGQQLVFEYLDGPGKEGIPLELFPQNTAPAAKKS